MPQKPLVGEQLHRVSRMPHPGRYPAVRPLTQKVAKDLNAGLDFFFLLLPRKQHCLNVLCVIVPDHLVAVGVDPLYRVWIFDSSKGIDVERTFEVVLFQDSKDAPYPGPATIVIFASSLEIIRTPRVVSRKRC